MSRVIIHQSAALSMIGEFNTLNALIMKIEGSDQRSIDIGGIVVPRECLRGMVGVMVSRRNEVRRQLLEWSIEPASRGDPHEDRHEPKPDWGDRS